MNSGELNSSAVSKVSQRRRLEQRSYMYTASDNGHGHAMPEKRGITERAGLM